MTSSSFYITTPIYYVNGAPHIGHVYTTMIADALARFHRMDNDEVFFLTGTDEHGLKIQRSAEARGISPQALADENSAKFSDTFKDLGIEHDRFIRTTEEQHKEVVRAMYDRLLASGDVYLDHYAGWYSSSDEAFYAEDEIQDGHAISSGSKVEWVEEQSYFFKLSAYQDRLIEWYDASDSHVQPMSARNEIRSFVQGGLKDLSISRTTFSWGIELPNDPAHVLYVWVDALTNYISALGGFGEDNEVYKKFWPCDVHLIGKDILRFHAVYWPAFLMSANLPLPKTVFAHGWWLNDGVKISKSLGNFITPKELTDAYDLDVLRYFLMREVPLGNDGNFDPERVVLRNNAELADNYGNLINRTFKMLKGFAGGKAPSATFSEEDQPLRDSAAKTVAQVRAHVHALAPHSALETTLKFSSELNVYLQTNQPWKLAKDDTKAERLAQVLYNTLEGIRVVTLLLAPFIPDTCGRVLTAMQQSQRDFSTLEEWGFLDAGTVIDIPDVLFAKLELPEKEVLEEAPKKKNEKKNEKKKKKAKAPQEPGQIDFPTFQSVEMKVGKVVEAQKVEGSEKLLKLMIDVGEEQPRQVVSGIAKSYEPETLVGRQFAVVTNLKPAKLFGILSQGMVLAVDRPDGSLELTEFSDALTPGSRIS